MSGPRVPTGLRRVLWPEEMSSRVDVYAVLDGAIDDLVYAFVTASYLDKECLYSGELPHEMMVTAPWLVKLEDGNSNTERILAHAWSRNWGIYLRTETSLRELRKHLRQFLRVRDETGRILLFRYYDPRVLRVYLPTCTPGELRTVFGPVQQFITEDETGLGAIEFGFDGKTLVQTHRELIADAAPAR